MIDSRQLKDSREIGTQERFATRYIQLRNAPRREIPQRIANLRYRRVISAIAAINPGIASLASQIAPVGNMQIGALQYWQGRPAKPACLHLRRQIRSQPPHISDRCFAGHECLRQRHLIGRKTNHKACLRVSKYRNTVDGEKPSPFVHCISPPFDTHCSSQTES